MAAAAEPVGNGPVGRAGRAALCRHRHSGTGGRRATVAALSAWAVSGGIKRWNCPLDRPVDARDRRPGEVDVPSTQILRYLRRADDTTRGALRWGMLTNGRRWRLYWQGALSVSEDFSKSTSARCWGCPAARPICSTRAGSTPRTPCGCSCCYLAGSAFLPSENGRTFHTIALEHGRRWEAKVARDLSRIVFDEVFPILAVALARHDRGRPTVPDGAWLEQIRQGSLILLYRLLFVLYAEDRDLLPDERGPYAALLPYPHPSRGGRRACGGAGALATRGDLLGAAARHIHRNRAWRRRPRHPALQRRPVRDRRRAGSGTRRTAR